MKWIKLFVIISWVILACEDPSGPYMGIWIDEKCDGETIDLIEQSLDDLNAAVGTPIYYLEGTASAVITDDTDFIICKTGYWQPKGLGGQCVNGDIVIYTDRLPTLAMRMNAIKHELGHHLEGDTETDGHSKDPKDVMYHVIKGNHRYTANDIVKIKKWASTNKGEQNESRYHKTL